MSYPGFGSLKTVSDLFKKLEKEYEDLESEPHNEYMAFNFFITALHVIDWIYPSKNDKAKRDALEASNVILQICSHIGNGAKHFEATAKKHGTVKDVKSKGTIVAPLIKSDNGWRLGPTSTHLCIKLDGDAEAKLGKSISAVYLAKMVLEFWRTYLSSNGML